MIRTYLQYGVVALCTTIIGFNATPTLAGFQFKAPVEEVTVPDKDTTLPLPNTALLPEISDNLATPSVTEAPLKSSPSDDMKATSSGVQPRPIINWSDEISSPHANTDFAKDLKNISPPLPVPNMEMEKDNAPTTQYDIAVGFGRNLPLISALRQIIPADYTFAIGAGVKAGQPVSWQGGQEWNVVLDKTLSSVNLSSRIQAKRVLITNNSDAMVSLPSVDYNIDDFQLDPSSRPTLAQALHRDETPTPIDLVPSYAESNHLPSSVLSNDAEAKNTMDRLYISQPNRRPQILTRPSQKSYNNFQQQRDISALKTMSGQDKKTKILTQPLDNTTAPLPANIPPSHKLEKNKTVTDSGIHKSSPIKTAKFPSEPINLTPPNKQINNKAKTTQNSPSVDTPQDKKQNDSQHDTDETEALAQLELLENTPLPMIKKPKTSDATATTRQDDYWTAPSGSSLKTVLESWTLLEEVDLFWSSDYDFILAGDVQITGTFDEAVQTLLNGFSRAVPKPVGRLHPNLPNGPAVLVIETRQPLS